MIEITSIDLVVYASAAMAMGLIMLIKGGDWTVDSATTIAERMGIPATIIGFTIVAFGTSLPELIVSINSNLSGFPGLSMGNVVGSNIANVLLILGASAVITPLIFKGRSAAEDMAVMVVSSFVLVALVYNGIIEQWHGGAMFGFLVAYVLYKLTTTKNKDDEELILSEEKEQNKSLLFASALLIVGLASVSIGSEFLVRGAVDVAEFVGVPQAVIGLTLVAIGTSLPELSVAIQAARKKENDIVIGNVVGSNVFNILSILGLTALIKPLEIEQGIVQQDILFMTAVALFLVVLAYVIKRSDRLGGILMLIVYFGYIAFRYVN